MAHLLKTAEVRKPYALRKQTPMPVFGIIESVLGFRQFLLRGLENVRGEWNLVAMAWNLTRRFVLTGANQAEIVIIRAPVSPIPALAPSKFG